MAGCYNYKKVNNMKLYKISLALILGLGTMTSCEDKLDVVNVNQQNWRNVSSQLIITPVWREPMLV